MYTQLTAKSLDILKPTSYEHFDESSTGLTRPRTVRFRSDVVYSLKT